MTIPAEAARPDNGFIDALHVSRPADEHAGKLMLFGRFVGSWDLEWAFDLGRTRQLPGAAVRWPARRR